MCRLAVSQDQSFFVSASADGTAKVWATRGLDRAAAHRSVATYDAHRRECSAASVSDACCIDNARSVATASSQGDVHVWRVELARDASSSARSVNGSQASRATGSGSERSKGPANLALVRRLSPSTGTRNQYLCEDEGPVISVNHYNTDVQSLVVYGTQRGVLHAADLRESSQRIFLKLSTTVYVSSIYPVRTVGNATRRESVYTVWLSRTLSIVHFLHREPLSVSPTLTTPKRSQQKYLDFFFFFPT